MNTVVWMAEAVGEVVAPLRLHSSLSPKKDGLQTTQRSWRRISGRASLAERMERKRSSKEQNSRICTEDL